jgi:hypothetical protein
MENTKDKCLAQRLYEAYWATANKQPPLPFTKVTDKCNNFWHDYSLRVTHEVAKIEPSPN